MCAQDRAVVVEVQREGKGGKAEQTKQQGLD